MKYALLFSFGILTGLAFNHLPRFQPFRNETLPKTPAEWQPKMRGAWTDEDRRTIEGYYNGGKN